MSVRGASSISSSRGGFAPKRSVIPVGLLTAFLLASCSDPPDPRTDDVPTRGHILILADEDLRDLVQAEEYMFESIYRDAQLDIRYLPEAELLTAVMNDSVRCWIGTVQPGGEQEAYYAKRSVKAHVVPIAMDGIAVVVNKQRALASLSIAMIEKMLTNRAGYRMPMTWGNVDTSSSDGLPQPVFPQTGSGLARSLVDSLFHGARSLTARALPSIDSVVAQVANNDRCVGFLPFAAISDLDNPKMKALRDRVKLLAISASDSSAAFLPNQGTLADGSYPLRRPVYMVLCEGKSGLGTGFVSFVANHKGQRIILKHGLAPNNVPPREIEIVSQ